MLLLSGMLLLPVCLWQTNGHKLSLMPLVLDLEIQRERDERNAVLHDAGVELHYLALVHEQPLRAHGVAVEDVALFIRAYVQPAGEQLAVLDLSLIHI